jgi:hypothetical protein
MGPVIYTLCFLTALLCAYLLLRSYSRTRVSLLFWSGLCFVALSINNLFLILDQVALPEVNFSLWRLGTALAAPCLLLFGLIWEHD